MPNDPVSISFTFEFKRNLRALAKKYRSIRSDIQPLIDQLLSGELYKEKSITFEMPGWYCDQSEESIHTGDDMKVSDRRLNLLKARCEGLLEPEEIHRIRKKLHLTQEAAGLLIGGGQRAFQKCESGDLLPSRAVSNALVLLDHDPEGLSVLKAHSKAA